ncbi:MAG: FAD-dependent oxidoreductase [Peptococcaceae bacterium]|nr:FAD-dependent oxidoreductase [Peptococcaceae bacterium]
MVKVVVVGGGWSGCGAAIAAAKAGAQVTLLERTDMLLGTGLVGGIMRNNGRFTATEEAIAMGANELFDATDATARHKNLDFPGHKHSSLYDVAKIEPAVEHKLTEAGVDWHLEARFADVVMDGKKIKAVKTEDGTTYEADIFVDCTGTAGPQGNCMKYGQGCGMCILRCPSFGPRVSLAGKAGAPEFMGKKGDGSYGAMSGSCKLFKESLSKEIQDELNSKGVAVIPIPQHLRKSGVLAKKACQQYALPEFEQNVILLDTGHAKLMTPYYPLHNLRQIPGFEDARFEDPYAGGRANSMRYMAVSYRDNHLKVEGVENLFCGGEKAGLLVGHTEAIVTGYLAGANAVRYAAGKELIEIPTTLAIGDAIDYVGKQMRTEDGIKFKYTFSGSVYFKRMQELGLYTTDVAAIKDRVKKAGVEGVYNQKVC